MGNCCITEEPSAPLLQPSQVTLGQPELFVLRKELHESIQREAILRGRCEQLRQQTQVLIDRNHYLEMNSAITVAQKIPVIRSSPNTVI